MINVSDAFKQKLQDGERVWQEVEITFPDGTVKTVKNEIMGENCSFSDCAESSSFPIGCVVCKSMTLELDNSQDQWKNYNFYMAKVHAYLKMQTSVASPAVTDELLDESHEPILDQSGGTILVTKAATKDRIETIDKGIYTITTPEQYGEILSFTALDDMYKTNATYTSHLVLPQPIETLVRDACETLGIPFGGTMQHGNLVVSELPENMTFRQLFGWAAMLETANARLDSRGYLRFIRWDFSNVQEDYSAVVDVDGNVTFKGGASIDSENFISPVGNWTIDSDGFLTLIESAADTSERLKDFFTSPTVSSDDIVITGIKLKNKENEAMYGSTGYVLELENDLVADSDLETVAAQIGDSIIGVKFRNMSGELAYNPLIEFGDMAYTYDRKWNRYITPLTDVSCSVNGKTAVKTQADDPIRGQSVFQSESTKAIVEARRLVKKEQSAREKAVEKLEETLKNSSGLYETSVTQEDGSTITYLHDKPTLAESKNVIKFTAEAIGVSNDGGKTYPYGFFLTGDLIAKILYAHGINADYIDTGALIVRDSDGNIIFQVDMDTKKVIISGDSVVIGGKTATKALSDNLQESKDYSDGKLADYADTVTGSLAGLQAQIDGQIESFFYDYEPSLQNLPASKWTSTEERKKHEGDLFYWKSTGYAYRFMQDGAVWKWQMIQDNDISKALAQAEKAQDTADGKRRTFVVQPSPPYDIGDLWSQEGGDILTCVVSRAKGSVYVSSDWQKLNKYTDDTTANKALEAASLARNMTLQLSNDMQTIASDADGNIPTFPTVATAATVMYGTQDITDDCSFTITKSVNVTGSWNDVTHVYNVTGLTADNGWVDIKATYLTNLAVTKRFTISKQKQGKQGIQGVGKDGKTTYLHIRYSPVQNPTASQMTTVPDSNTVYIGTYSDFDGVPSADPSDYTWAKFKGDQGGKGDKGDPGTDGKDGKSSYTWIRYATRPDGLDMSDNPDYVKLLDSTGSPILDSVGEQIYTVTQATYIGIATNKDTATESDDPTDYIWSRFRGVDGYDGKDGADGIPGKDGKDGKTQYTHLAYANSADGQTDFSVDNPDRTYIGMYADFTEADSTNPSDYAWSLIKGSNGKDGIPGKPGADGKTPYFHIAYANSADGKEGFSVDDSVGKLYIGQYTDYTPDDSTNPENYSWTKIKGEQGVPGRTYFIELTSDVAKRGADKVISPSTVQAFAYYRDGDGATRTAYSGLWKVQLSTDGKTWIDTTTISKPTTNIAVQLSDVTITEDKNYVKFVLYAADGFTNLLDSQTVPILTDVSSLTQQEIVEILSNNGDWNGLYYLDGRLYISFSAALGGTLKIGGVKNTNGVIEVTDGEGNVAVRLDQNGINAIAGKFSGELNGATGKFSGTLESVDGTFTGILNGATGSFTGKVGSYNNNGEFSQLDAGCVEVGTIEDGEITGYLSTSEFKDTGNWGMRVAGRGVVAFSTPYILVGDYKEYNEDFVGSIGQSGTCKVITEISTTGSSSGLIINSLKTKTVTFEKGLMVTAI